MTDEEATAVLRQIARRQLALSVYRIGSLKTSGLAGIDVLAALEWRGLAEPVPANASYSTATPQYVRLTRKGWEALGDVPMWVA